MDDYEVFIPLAPVTRIVSFDADGFTLDWSAAPAAASEFRVIYFHLEEEKPAISGTICSQSGEGDPPGR